MQVFNAQLNAVCGAIFMYIQVYAIICKEANDCATVWKQLCNQICNKVNRCLARYSPRATTTKRPTNRAPNKPAWPGPN